MPDGFDFRMMVTCYLHLFHTNIFTFQRHFARFSSLQTKKVLKNPKLFFRRFSQAIKGSDFHFKSMVIS